MKNTPSLRLRGLLIAIDGIDGSGKTTLAHGLQQHMPGLKAVVSKEPTAGPWGMKLRDSAAAGRLSIDDELRYLELDRRQHVEELINPVLNNGGCVILDRYFYSTVAYQGAGNHDADRILRANLAFAPLPDVTLILDMDVPEALLRIRARGDVPNSFERTETLVACREIFRHLAVTEAECHLIDASKPVDQVLSAALKAVAVAVAEKAHREHGFTQAAGEQIAERLIGISSV